MDLDPDNLTPEQRKRLSQLFEIHKLKAASGALSFADASNSQEAALFSGLLRDEFWPSWRKRITASFDVRNFVRHNAIIAFLDQFSLMVKKNPELPYPLLLLIYLEEMEHIYDDSLAPRINKLRAYFIEKLSIENCFDHSEI